LNRITNIGDETSRANNLPYRTIKPGLLTSSKCKFAALVGKALGNGKTDSARTPRHLGGVDILVNNAGTMYSGRFASLKDDELKNQFETKLFGFMRAIRLVYPMMKAQKWGRIVNTIGGAGKEPDPYMFGSAMTNSALLNLTKSLSEEFGEDNVLVNAICPGWVATDLWVRNAEGLKKELNVKSEDEARKLAARKNSLGRMGKPEELANATVFLCSERSSYITGVSLNLDGGRLKGLW
jgi:3-oxoacyl-[acyl-carrier protein] reductase